MAPVRLSPTMEIDVPSPGISKAPFTLFHDGWEYQGWIAHTEKGPRAPLVLVLPNYAGLKQFDIDVAVFLAKLGYVGLAVDLYRDQAPAYASGTKFGSTAPYPRDMRSPQPDWTPQKRAQHAWGAFSAMNDLLRHPVRWRALMSAYLQSGQSHRAVAPGKAAAIGYCFGGQCVLEMCRNGDDLQGVVSFHGLLQSLPLWLPGLARSAGVPSMPEGFRRRLEVPTDRYTKSCKVLIENGDSDQLVPQESIEKFKAEMDGHGIDWQFHNHARTQHGFALAPDVGGGYHEAADRRSTMSMISLFAELWPEHPPRHTERNACGTVLGQGVVGAPLARL